MNQGLFLLVGAFLFSTGLATVIVKRNLISILIGIELILNAANINLVAFSAKDPEMKGQVFALFIVVVAASEAAVGLAIILLAYKYFKTSNADEISKLKG